MPEPTRRGFLVATGGSAAAVAAMSLIGSADAAAALDQPDSGPLHVGDGPFVAYVENARSGRITVFAGTGAVTVTDRHLVRSIVRRAERS